MNVDSRVLTVLLDLFERQVSLSATHDTIEDHHLPRSDPASASSAHRLLLARLLAWAQDSNPHAPPVLWVTGPTGSGKTAIAGTLAEMLQKLDLLGATFFLNSDPDDSIGGREVRRGASEPFLVPTLALQLSESVPALQPLMIDVVQRAPFLFHRSLCTQMERLIVRPLLSLPFVSPGGDVDGEGTTFQPVIIIDGLDSHHAPGGAAARVLGAIQDAAPRLWGRAKFLLFSRSEQGETQAATLSAMSAVTLRIDLELTALSSHVQQPSITPDTNNVSSSSVQSEGPNRIKETTPNEMVSAGPSTLTAETPMAISTEYPSPNPNLLTTNNTNPANPGHTTQTFYMPPIPLPDDACVECMMRDCDMADVDVTSPGVWERESDVHFKELKSRQLEEANGDHDPVQSRVVDANSDHTAARTTPRIAGADPLTERNIQLWLKEVRNTKLYIQYLYELGRFTSFFHLQPSRESSKLVRVHILSGYIKSQWKLLQAEHAIREPEAGAARENQEVTGDEPGNNSASGSPDQRAYLTENQTDLDSLQIRVLENELVVELVDNQNDEAEDPVQDQTQTQQQEAPPESSQDSPSSEPSIDTTAAGEFTSTDGSLVQIDPHPQHYSPWSLGRLTGVLTYPLDHLFSAWTTFCVQQWP